MRESEGTVTAENPDHYRRNGVEASEIMEAVLLGEEVDNVTAYWWGCALKYLFRWTRKNGVEDLRKAKCCVERMIERIED